LVENRSSSTRSFTVSFIRFLSMLVFPPIYQDTTCSILC